MGMERRELNSSGYRKCFGLKGCEKRVAAHLSCGVLSASWGSAGAGAVMGARWAALRFALWFALHSLRTHPEVQLMLSSPG